MRGGQRAPHEQDVKSEVSSREANSPREVAREQAWLGSARLHLAQLLMPLTWIRERNATAQAALPLGGEKGARGDAAIGSQRVNREAQTAGVNRWQSTGASGASGWNRAAARAQTKDKQLRE